MSRNHLGPAPRLLRRFLRDQKGSSAIQFAIVVTPFIFMIMLIVQLGLFFTAQSALDLGVLKAAGGLRQTFLSTTSPSFPTASTLKATVANRAGGLIKNDATLKVDLRPVSQLTSATVAVTDGTMSYGITGETLVLRVESSITMLGLGFSVPLVARSSAIIKRQGT